jgi:hypothetical protein
MRTRIKVCCIADADEAAIAVAAAQTRSDLSVECLPGPAVGPAIRHVRPFGVDLCSGVRVAGRLNRDRLTAFVAAVQATDRAS